MSTTFPAATLAMYEGAFAITPDGVVDGVNDTFMLLPGAPNPPESLLLFLNGLLQRPGVDFTLTDATIVYAVPPTAVPSPDWHLAFYRKGGLVE